MIRSEEIREVLSTIAEPLEACRELTDRANRAGGHDNITVIVARFEGSALVGPGPDDPTLAYQKYALPEAPPDHESVVRVAVSTLPGEAATLPPSDESRDPRRLRVGHTMVSLANAVTPEMMASANEGPTGLRAPSAPPLASYGPADEPVELPTTGFPPSLVGFMVLGAMVLAAVAGFLLLR